ncbi:MAG: hypothetical protein JWM43_1427 [Acidobacteriaceae bacterium]|nr:hypothetical protein [Acidobacteriaceae bacterium]
MPKAIKYVPDPFMPGALTRRMMGIGEEHSHSIDEQFIYVVPKTGATSRPTAERTMSS